MSWAEVRAGIELGLFDSTPMYQRTFPVGSWEAKTAGLLPKARPWDGLL